MPSCLCNIFKTLSVLAKGTKAAMAKSSIFLHHSGENNLWLWETPQHASECS